MSKPVIESKTDTLHNYQNPQEEELLLSLYNFAVDNFRKFTKTAINGGEDFIDAFIKYHNKNISRYDILCSLCRNARIDLLFPQRKDITYT